MQIWPKLPKAQHSNCQPTKVKTSSHRVSWLPLSRSQFASHIRTNLVESWSRGCRTKPPTRSAKSRGTAARRHLGGSAHPPLPSPLPRFPLPCGAARAPSGPVERRARPARLRPALASRLRRGGQAAGGDRRAAASSPGGEPGAPPAPASRDGFQSSRSFFSIQRQCIHTFTATGTSA